MSKPKVSICTLAYNQEKYIKQTLDGLIMQKTDFPFEVLIHDDASTDQTANIIREYEAKYPDIIKPIYQTQNQYALAKNGEKYFNLPRVQGEYVAICEGDDYWTDENKLQKQADFLDANPDYTICFHPVKIIYEDGSAPDKIFPDFKNDFPEVKELNFISLLQKNYIQTNSVMYRWLLDTQEKIDTLYPDNIIPSDLFVHLLHAHEGKIGFIDEVMAVYRRHSAGFWQTDEDFHLRYGIYELTFYVALEKHFPEYIKYQGHEYTCAIARQMVKLYNSKLDFVKMQEVLKLCPDCLSYGIKK